MPSSLQGRSCATIKITASPLKGFYGTFKDKIIISANSVHMTNELITQNAGMDMRTEIRRERTIELFNEGFRLDDLKRWKTKSSGREQGIIAQ